MLLCVVPLCFVVLMTVMCVSKVESSIIGTDDCA